MEFRNLTLLTDLYQLTMMNGYLKENRREETAVFDVFFRQNGMITYSVACGLEQTVDYILNLRFGEEEIEYLKNLGIFDDDFLEYLKDFKFISVREKTAKEILYNLKDDSWQPDIKVTLDPTLFLSKEEWNTYRKEVNSLPLNGYILTYYMIETPLLRYITDLLQKQTGLPVVNIKPSKRQMLFHEGINLPGIGPGEFLSCYAGAKYVVTNSFHGTAFAINYGKSVYVSPLPVSMAGEVNSRLIDLLETFGILERWIDTQEKAMAIDFNDSLNVSSILDEKRNDSKKILMDMIYSEDTQDG